MDGKGQRLGGPRRKYGSHNDGMSDHAGLSDCTLQLQNAEHVGTGGISRNNRRSGFLPAYRNVANGQTVISRFADGRPAPIHVLDGLPQEWIASRDAEGRVASAVCDVVAGFVRGGIFYTREAAASVVADEQDRLRR